MARCSPSSRTVSRMKSTSSATTSSRDGSASSPMISLSAHGLPWAARPTMTAAAPVVASTVCALAREVMSPGRDHGHVDELDELRRERVVGLARVHLLRRARVERERRGAGIDELRADLEAGPRAVREAAAHLDRERERDRVRDRLDDRARAAGLLEAVRARAGLRHLADGAAEVDVDDVRARVLDHAGGLGHHAGLGAEDLNRERMLVGGDPQVAERALVLVREPGAADHLRADEPGAEAAALAAEGLHADPGHRARARGGRGSRRPRFARIRVDLPA